MFFTWQELRFSTIRWPRSAISRTIVLGHTRGFAAGGPARRARSHATRPGTGRAHGAGRARWRRPGRGLGTGDALAAGATGCSDIR